MAKICKFQLFKSEDLLVSFAFNDCKLQIIGFGAVSRVVARMVAKGGTGHPQNLISQTCQSHSVVL